MSDRTATTLTTHLGERFARAIADKDAAALKALLRPDVDFTAMTPTKFWERREADAVVDDVILGVWFGPERRITETLAVETDTIGSMGRVGYRLRFQRPDGEFTLEQQAYFQTEGDQISWLRIMCTGFLGSGTA
jgi:hypothetical protein